MAPHPGFHFRWTGGSSGEWALDQVGPQAGAILGVGHSMGGTALTMAEIMAPGTFGALVLIEPMLFPPPYQRAENELSVAVRKRRPSFASQDDARENFSSKPPFSTWQAGALEGYLGCGLESSEDGAIQLACTPEAEADVYEGATAHGAWERLGEVRIPVLILGGAESVPQPPDRVEAISRQFPRAGFEIIPGATHFLPMENPEAVGCPDPENCRRIRRKEGAGRAKP